MLSLPPVVQSLRNWVRSRTGHRLVGTLTSDMKTTYVAGKLASIVADSQADLNHEEHQGYEAEPVDEPGLLVVQPSRGLTTARIPTARLSKSRHPGAPGS